MVSVLDVAKLARVSTATVSRVLSGSPLVRAETRAKVLKVAQELGYHPNSFARNLRKGRGSSVALVAGDIEHGIYPSLARHLQSELEQLGLTLVLYNLGHQPERLHRVISQAAAMGLRGLLLASADVADMDVMKPLVAKARHTGVAILSVSQRLEDFGIDSIVHDDRAGAAMAVEYLAGRGRRRIAFLGRISPSMVGRERARGYAEGLEKAGLQPYPELVWDILDTFRGEAGYQMTLRALDAGIKFDAIVAASDELASGAIAALHDRNYAVPEDVAVTGFAGLDWGNYIRPALTSVRLDVATLAHEARQWLEAYESGASRPSLVLVRPELVLRGST